MAEAGLAEPALCLAPRPLRNTAAIRLPEGTCDSHLHVFDPHAPLASPRSYTPCPEGVEVWLALADSFGIARGVLVQPSVYGLDNRVLLSALGAHGDRLRGIVVVDPATPDHELRRLDGFGVRGVRVNLRNKAGIGPEAAAALAPRLAALGWHLQMQVGPEGIAPGAQLAEDHGLPVVIDHLAFMALDAPRVPLAALQRALDTGRVHVKISAPYRLRDMGRAEGYRAVVASLAASHPERLLWGSDWPHTELFDTMPEEDDLIALALDALPPDVRHRVFVENPDKLYWSR